jgi:hypothetical protein
MSVVSRQLCVVKNDNNCFNLIENFEFALLLRSIPYKKQAEYLKSKIPPGRRPLWPLWAGGRNPNSKIYPSFIIDKKSCLRRNVFMTIAIINPLPLAVQIY